MKATFVLIGVLIAAAVAWFGFAPGMTSNILIEDAVAYPMKDGSIGIYLTVNNQGTPDVLTSVTSSAGDVMLHKPFGAGDLPIQTGRSALASDAAHVMMATGDASFDIGALIPITLTFANAGDVQLKARMSEPAMQGHAGMMMDDMPAMDVDMPAPSLSLSASAKGAGWQIGIDVENFVFSEETVDMPHEAGIGHGHIYVGGMKLGRVFGADYEIGQLPKGTHKIRVTLNTNDHQPYMGTDGPVTATTVIEVD